MQNTKIISNWQNSLVESSIFSFFKKFNINKILNQTGIRKVRGHSPQNIIMAIMQLPFIQKNFYEGIVQNESLTFNKTAAYDLLNNSRFNWRIFLYRVAVTIIIQFIKPLTGNEREDVLILDDSSHPRNKSKRVELLANCFDHVTHGYFKGFRILQLGWSDGNGLIPLDFSVLSSNNPENRFQEMNDKIDKRSCGYKRRMEAITKTPELIPAMIARAQRMGIKAKYLLMDSWFSFPSLLIEINEFINIICMVKNTPKVSYYKEGEKFTVSQLYRQMKKRKGKAEIKGSQIVDIIRKGKALKVKLVFVANRNDRSNWLAILSTDIELSDEEIVRIYGKRWDIEIFFKVIKHCLNLNKEVELRNFDGIIAHITIVQLRYIFLTVEQRNDVDDKTYGGVFLELIDEMKDITIIQAILRIMALAFDAIRKLKIITDNLFKQLIEIFLGIVIQKYNLVFN